MSAETNRTIPSALDEPTAVAELVEACDVPRSTVYPRLNALHDPGAVVEHGAGDAESGRYRRYGGDVERVSVSVDGNGGLTARVERPKGNPDEETTCRPTEPQRRARGTVARAGLGTASGDGDPVSYPGDSGPAARPGRRPSAETRLPVYPRRFDLDGGVARQ